MSVNSCLAPLCVMDTCAVTTVEGVAEASGLHEVQKALVESHASQCGYCTPGFVMALYAMVKQRETGEQLTMEDIEHGMDGNLVASFGDNPDVAHCKDTCPGCPNAKNGDVQVDIEDLHGDKLTEVTCWSSRKIRQLAEQRKLCDKDASVVTSGSKMTAALAVSSFPNELVDKAMTPQVLQIDGKQIQWFAPVTMTHLLQLKQQFPDAKISVGNTEMGIETKFKGFRYAHLINVSRVPELVATKDVTATDNINQTVFAGAEPFEGDRFGAEVTLTDVKQQLSELIRTLPSYQTRAFESIVKMLKWFASTHIRNVACIAGNLVTASPISDMNPLLAAMNAYIELPSTRGTPYTRVRDFFLSYRKVGMEPDEIITAVYVLFTKEWEYMPPFKQARRREDDISIVTAGIRVRLECSQNTGAWIIQDASAVYGGMAPITKPASETDHFLVMAFDALMRHVACYIRAISSCPMVFQGEWQSTGRVCARHSCTSSLSRRRSYITNRAA
ncbi:Xanthine dehydrogenase, molybdopterin binding subunit [Phytophthora megakarya]|uniref:Xanthine dehydrogenase, molybdopterin binding subunit n=1 Tax=Phytophthora megakarya TaxID=4795 RepID=A0A225VEZ3_9STRA|nr:Xanthine dehydrogenase, molybdopterin binding subunit [Phytophthora megakarya]